jgi:hypothetical protein
MKKYKNKQIIEAERWFKIGDVQEANITKNDLNPEGFCLICSLTMISHGKMILFDSSYDVICPGDWIVRYDEGKYLPHDNDHFLKFYEEINEKKIID